jgi:hypothetical protein
VKTYGVRDLLDGFDVIARNEFVVGVEELDAGLLKCTLGQQQTLDPRKALYAKLDIANI